MYFFVLVIWVWNIYLFRLAYISIFHTPAPLEDEAVVATDTKTFD